MSIHLSVPSLPNQNEHGEQWRFFTVSRLEKRNATIPDRDRDAPCGAPLPHH